jgi:hypothetical protein
MDPGTFLSRLDAAAPPTTPNGWECGLSSPHRYDEPQPGWGLAVAGLVSSPDWNLIQAAWSYLNNDVHDIITRSSVGDEVPRSMSSPSDFAWLDRIGGRDHIPDETRIVAHRDLGAPFVARFAESLVNQYARWRAWRVIPVPGCRQNVDHVVQDTLANLSSFWGPLPKPILDRARELHIHYPPGIFREPPTEVDRTGVNAGGRRVFYPTGVALVQGKDAGTSIPVCAGHGMPVHLPGASGYLLELLDIDITSPEMSFLGLCGSRLRICDWADPFLGRCFTRVTLDGGVSLHTPAATLPEPGPYSKPSGEFLTAGRPLVSPLEGMRETGRGGTSERLGGVPSWEQDSEWPISPVDYEPMTFVGQFPHPVSGTAYVFLDIPNLIATVVKQWD